MKVIKWCEPEPCENTAWEKAYSEFESRKQAVQKMEKRLGEFQIQKRLKKNALILDCFCGTGCMSEALKKHGFKNAVGLDLSLSLLLKNRSSKKVICGNAIKTKFKVKTFDAIFIQGGLHHLPNPKKNLRKLFLEHSRILKKNGYILITEPYQETFLFFVHLVLKYSPWLPKKLLCLKKMIEEEEQSYFFWLENAKTIINSSLGKLRIIHRSIKNGKINLIISH